MPNYIKHIFDKYRSTTRSGQRISRGDFLMLMCINITIMIILVVAVQYFYQGKEIINQFSLITGLKIIFGILLIVLPLFITGIIIGICKARLNDIGVGKSDIWGIINFILTVFPGINIIYFIILSVIKGQKLHNHHGGYHIK